jgi:mannose-6-phosphate isomerase-like protein (cupin superfamily)
VTAPLDPAGPAGPAEVELACAELGPALDFFTSRLGFRVETIFPAEEPRVASLSGHGLRVRLSPDAADAGRLRIPCRDPDALGERVFTTPNGTRIELVQADAPFVMPPFRPEFLITRRADGPKAGEGRAGMTYRDLIPGRLGGRWIASHITIPEGGPVADWVHFHKVAFQLIFVRRGWVRVVYEDQGEPFVMRPGDCVVQPPAIRHRVLESSPGLEVIEVGCPALHETLADHAMTLPTGRLDAERDFSGQRFLRHVAAEAPWTPLGDSGWEQRETGVGAAAGGIAEARVLRPAGADTLARRGHGGELLFGFVLDGSCMLDLRGPHALGSGDAFVVPPGEAWTLTRATPDLQLLEVTAPNAA